MFDENEEEVWKDIQGYEGRYQVSSLGRVKSLDRTLVNRDGRESLVKGVILKQTIRSRYLRVILSKDGNSKHENVHRLVAKTFVENPKDKPYVHHIDSNKHNNKESNLEWVTPLENSSDARKEGLYISGSRSPDSKISPELIPNILELYYNEKMLQKDIGAIYGVTQTLISKIVRGESWHFKEDYLLVKLLEGKSRNNM